MRVLHFSSQPICDEQLMLDVELRAIADALLPGKVLKSTSLESVPQARPSDVDVYLNTVRPDIVHFSCHGEKKSINVRGESEGGLKLCDAFLESQWYSPEELAEALKGMGVKLVVLNACQAGEIAKAILPHVDVVISSKTEAKINDEHAIVFSEVFYRSLQVGLPIGKAFAAASRELKLINFNAADAYELSVTDEKLKDQILLTQMNHPDSGTESDGVSGARHRLRGAAARLESARFGAAQDAAINGWKLGAALVIAVVLSVVAGIESEAEWMKSMIKTFGWIQVNPWLLFTFFAAPPAIYLIEYLWLRRPLKEAERVAFGLALKASESVDPEIVVERVEALVRELDESNKAIFNVIRGEKDDA